MHALFLESSSVKLQRSAIIEAYLHASAPSAPSSSTSSSSSSTTTHGASRDEHDTAAADDSHSHPGGGGGGCGSGHSGGAGRREVDAWAKKVRERGAGEGCGRRTGPPMPHALLACLSTACRHFFPLRLYTHPFSPTCTLYTPFSPILYNPFSPILRRSSRHGATTSGCATSHSGMPAWTWCTRLLSRRANRPTATCRYARLNASACCDIQAR